MLVAQKIRLCTLQLAADFEITSLRLLDQGGIVDATAEIEASMPPSTGSLEGVRDGGGCGWTLADARAPGFYIEWRFPAPVNVTALLFDGGPLQGGLVLVDDQPCELIRVGGEFRILDALDPLVGLTPDFLWKLDSTGASQVDVMGGVVATRSGGSMVSAPEQVGQPMAFSPGSNGYVTADIGGFNTGSFSAVFDLLTVGTSNTVVLECGENAGWSVQVETGGFFKINVGGNEFGSLASTVQIGDGVPRRLGFTYQRESQLTSLYVAGVIVAQKVLRTPINATALAVGSRFGAFPINMGSRIANVALWRRALSAEEMLMTRYRDTRRWLLPSTSLHHSIPAVIGNPPSAQGLQATDLSESGKALDVEFGGIGRIYGSVSRKSVTTNVPVARRVRLQRSVDGYLARETWSKVDGSYRFDEINERYEYDVTAWDHEKQEYSTVANNQLPEVAP